MLVYPPVSDLLFISLPVSLLDSCLLTCLLSSPYSRTCEPLCACLSEVAAPICFLQDCCHLDILVIHVHITVEKYSGVFMSVPTGSSARNPDARAATGFGVNSEGGTGGRRGVEQ